MLQVGSHAETGIEGLIWGLQVFDKERNGLIDAGELRHVLVQLEEILERLGDGWASQGRPYYQKKHLESTSLARSYLLFSDSNRLYKC